MSAVYIHKGKVITPTYVPAKASRVYPALKTCTSPRRAFRWQVKTGRLRHDPTIAAMYAYTETSLGYTARGHDVIAAAPNALSVLLGDRPRGF